MILESRRLLVRQFTADDTEAFYLMNSDPEIIRYIREPQNREQAWEFLQEKMKAYTSNPAYGSWAIVEKSGVNVIGTFMLRPSLKVKGSTEMGYSFFKPLWGRGYATEISKAGLEYAFRHLQLPLVIAITHPENTASQQVLLKCGFTKSGSLQGEEGIVYLFTIINTLNG